MYIKQHKNLDKKIWTNDDLLNPSVREMLLQIAWAYIDTIRSSNGINIYNSDIKDIIMFGSLTNYFYTTHSDIDICISGDIGAIQQRYQNIDIWNLLRLIKKDFLSIYDCVVFGHKININFEDSVTHVCIDDVYYGAQYSVSQNKWIQKPVKISKEKFRIINRDANKTYKQLKQQFYTIKKHGYKNEEIKLFLTTIYTYRRSVMTTNTLQPVTPIYLALRRFKHNGYIDKLREHQHNNKSKELILK